MAITGAAMVPHPPIILPRIGKGEEKKIQATAAAYGRAMAFIRDLAPSTIVLISSHAPAYFDYLQISAGGAAEGDLRQFGDPEDRFSVRYDESFAAELAGRCQASGLAAGTLGEQEGTLDHGSLVPLYFLDQYLSDYRLVRIGIGGLTLREHYRLGMLIGETAASRGGSTALIASGDLSHCLKAAGPYGFRPAGPAYDRRIMEIMGCADFSRLLDFSEPELEEAEVCGHKCFCILAGAFDGVRVLPQALSYQDTFGVGYGVCLYKAEGPDEGRRLYDRAVRKAAAAAARRQAGEDSYVRLARQAISRYIREGKVLAVPPGLPDELTTGRSGAFVSIHEQGKLRGCIGTVSATADCLAREIIDNAIKAASEDPRFPAVRPGELDQLEISVDVLGPAEEVGSLSELDPQRYGVIVAKGRRRGLLLPDLEGVGTAAEQVAIAKRKAGLDPEEPDCRLARFEVVRHR